MKDHAMHDFDMYLTRCHQLLPTAPVAAAPAEDEELCVCANFIRHEEDVHSLTEIKLTYV